MAGRAQSALVNAEGGAQAHRHVLVLLHAVHDGVADVVGPAQHSRRFEVVQTKMRKQLHSLSGPPVRVVQLGAVAPDLGALRALVVGPDPARLLARLNSAVRLDLRHAELTDVLVGLRQQTTGQSCVVNVKRKARQASTASSWIAAKDSYSDSQ